MFMHVIENRGSGLSADLSILGASASPDTRQPRFHRKHFSLYEQIFTCYAGKTTTIVRYLVMLKRNFGIKVPILACAQSNVSALTSNSLWSF